MTWKRTHELKTWPEPFDAVVSGTKRFEFRRDDRGFAVGDVLVLRRWDPSPACHGLSIPVGYGRDAKCAVVRVTYVLRGFGVPEGFVVLSIEPVEEKP